MIAQIGKFVKTAMKKASGHSHEPCNDTGESGKGRNGQRSTSEIVCYDCNEKGHK